MQSLILTYSQLKNGEWTRTGKMLRMVAEDSACTFGPAECIKKFHSHTDHSKLVKFSTPDNEIYKEVLNSMREAVSTGTTLAKVRFRSMPQIGRNVNCD